MEQQRIDMYIMANGSNLPSEKIPTLRKHLEAASDDKFFQLESLSLKNPTTALIISILAGAYGIDRFYIGDIGLGVAKLLTCGGLGIWAIVDWFLIMNMTKDKNLEKVAEVLQQ